MFHRRGLSQRRGLGRAKRADDVRPTRVLSDGFTVVSLLRVEKRCRSPLAPLPYSLLLLDPCLCLFMLSFFASSSHPFFCMPFTSERSFFSSCSSIAAAVIFIRCFIARSSSETWSSASDLAKRER